MARGRKQTALPLLSSWAIADMERTQSFTNINKQQRRSMESNAKSLRVGLVSCLFGADEDLRRIYCYSSDMLIEHIRFFVYEDLSEAEEREIAFHFKALPAVFSIRDTPFSLQSAAVPRSIRLVCIIREETQREMGFVTEEEYVRFFLHAPDEEEDEEEEEDSNDTWADTLREHRSDFKATPTSEEIADSLVALYEALIDEVVVEEVNHKGIFRFFCTAIDAETVASHPDEPIVSLMKIQAPIAISRYKSGLRSTLKSFKDAFVETPEKRIYILSSKVLAML
jgi:hypothetical protein